MLPFIYPFVVEGPVDHVCDVDVTIGNAFLDK